MISYNQLNKSNLNVYDKIPIKLEVKSHFEIEKIERGLQGIKLVEKNVVPYVKDFALDKQNTIEDLNNKFDTSNWAFFIAYDEDKPIGGAIVASRTKGVNMLENRSDLAVLWDLRVIEEYKRIGVGQTLFDKVVNWARANDLKQIKIECQNTNVPAVKFYHKQEAELSRIDEYAYYLNPSNRGETQLIWYKNI